MQLFHRIQDCLKTILHFIPLFERHGVEAQYREQIIRFQLNSPPMPFPVALNKKLGFVLEAIVPIDADRA